MEHLRYTTRIKAAHDTAFEADDPVGPCAVWQVEAVDPGKTLTLYDPLCHERYHVPKPRNMPQLIRGDAALARVVVREDGAAEVRYAHESPLPPFVAADLVRRARRRLGRRGRVSRELVGRADFAAYLVRRWEDAIRDIDLADHILFGLYNEDGDPFVITRDRFCVMPEKMTEINTRVAGLTGFGRLQVPDRSSAYMVQRRVKPDPWGLEWTSVGLVWITPTVLWIETDSRKRGDRLRKRIETACGSDIRHNARMYLDSIRCGNYPGNPAPVQPKQFWLEPESPFMLTKETHYDCWLDRPLGILKGKKSWDCVRTSADRALLDRVLDDMEHIDRRGPGPRFDFSTLRRGLGLDVQ